MKSRTHWRFFAFGSYLSWQRACWPCNIVEPRGFFWQGYWRVYTPLGVFHMNKTIHTLSVIAIMIELSGRGAGSWYIKCGGWDKNTLSSESSTTRGVVNTMGRGKARGGVVTRRGRGKARVASPCMGRDFFPGREPGCSRTRGPHFWCFSWWLFLRGSLFFLGHFRSFFWNRTARCHC